MTPRLDYGSVGEVVVSSRCGFDEFSAPSEIRVHAYPPRSRHPDLVVDASATEDNHHRSTP
jgi:hypothetical protein